MRFIFIDVYYDEQIEFSMIQRCASFQRNIINLLLEGFTGIICIYAKKRHTRPMKNITLLPCNMCAIKNVNTSQDDQRSDKEEPHKYQFLKKIKIINTIASFVYIKTAGIVSYFKPQR